MRILCDIDDTLCQTSDFIGFGGRIGKFFRIPIFQNVQNTVQYPHRDQDRFFWHLVTSIWYLVAVFNLSIPLYVGVKKSLTELLQNNKVEIIFYTMRPSITLVYTRKYLAKLVPNPRVYFAAHHRKNCYPELLEGKLAVIQAVKPDIVIENDVEVVRQARDRFSKIIFIVFGHSHGHGYENCCPANNWQEIVQIIQKIQPSLESH